LQVKVVLEVDNKLGIYLLGVISGEKRGPLALEEAMSRVEKKAAEFL